MICITCNTAKAPDRTAPFCAGCYAGLNRIASTYLATLPTADHADPDDAPEPDGVPAYVGDREVML